MPKKKTPTKKFQNQLTKWLDASKVKYKLLQHKLVYTAHDAAQTTKKKLSEIAKVVLIKADKDFVLIVLPAGKYVDLKAVQKALASAKGGSLPVRQAGASGGKKVSMATEKDIAKHLKTKVGLLHPFGSQYKLQTLLDKSMSKAKKILASAGSYTQSVEIGLKDFEKLVNPLKGVFSKAKR